MKYPTLQKICLGILLLCACGAAAAHPGHDITGFSAGFFHPFTGLDHLLAMFAVGLWAAQMGGRKIWLLPATFMLTLVAGAALALHVNLPLMDTSIATSVLALGLLIALALRLPTTLSLVIIALFGTVHGYAHGLEMPGAAASMGYALGFLIATASLHVAGIGMGIATQGRSIKLTQIIGVAIAAAGIWMFA